MEQNTITNPEIDAILEIEADDVSNPNDTSWARIVLQNIYKICEKEQLKLIVFAHRDGDETGIRSFSAIIPDGYYKLKSLRKKHVYQGKYIPSSAGEYAVSSANIYVIPYYKNLPNMSKDEITHDFFTPSSKPGPTEYGLEDTVLLTHTQSNISVFVNQKKELKDNCETALDILKNKVLHHTLYTLGENDVVFYYDSPVKESDTNTHHNFENFIDINLSTAKNITE